MICNNSKVLLPSIVRNGRSLSIRVSLGKTYGPKTLFTGTGFKSGVYATEDIFRDLQ
jgi:hypothetical protein